MSSDEIANELQRADDVDTNSDSDAGSDWGNNDEVPEITELCWAYDHLISKHSSKKGTTSNTTRETEEISPESIPSMVNRILMEHYSFRPCMTSKDSYRNTQRSLMTKEQKEKMTLYLTAVIVEFAQPHFVRVMKYTDQIQKMQQHQQHEKNKDSEENIEDDSTRQLPTAKRRKASQQPQNSPPPSNIEVSVHKPATYDYDQRAISWATQSLKKLLQPLPIPTATSSSSNLPHRLDIGGHVEKPSEKRTFEETHIPELDALLSATGQYDSGMEMEYKMQRALLEGLQGRRLMEMIRR